MLVALGALVVILPTKTEKTSRLASEGSIDSFAGSFRKTHSEGTIPRHNRYEGGGGGGLFWRRRTKLGKGQAQDSLFVDHQPSGLTLLSLLRLTERQ